MRDDDQKFSSSDYIKSTISIQVCADTFVYDLAALERQGRSNCQTRRDVYHFDDARDVVNAIDVVTLDVDDGGWDIYVMTA